MFLSPGKFSICPQKIPCEFLWMNVQIFQVFLRAKILATFTKCTSHGVSYLLFFPLFNKALGEFLQPLSSLTETLPELQNRWRGNLAGLRSCPKSSVPPGDGWHRATAATGRSGRPLRRQVTIGVPKHYCKASLQRRRQKNSPRPPG